MLHSAQDDKGAFEDVRSFLAQMELTLAYAGVQFCAYLMASGTHPAYTIQ